MIEHPLRLVTAVLTALVAGIATRVQLLPEVIDLSSVPTLAGLGGLVAAGCAAALRFPPDRLAKVTLLGNLLGALVAVIAVLLALAVEII